MIRFYCDQNTVGALLLNQIVSESEELLDVRY